jgi:hypothetical protein
MPEQFTPLPLVEAALPIVAMFAGLVGRGKLARYRVARLRELAVLPRARLPIRAIHDSVPWMERLRLRGSSRISESPGC